MAQSGLTTLQGRFRNRQDFTSSIRPVTEVKGLLCPDRDRHRCEKAEKAHWKQSRAELTGGDRLGIWI